MVRSVPLVAKIFAVVLAVVIALYMLAPILVVAGASVNTDRFLSFPPQGFGFGWYRDILTSDLYLAPFRTSLGIATTVAVLSSVAGTAAAIAVTRFRFPGSSAILAFVMSPLIIPSIILAIGLLAFLSTYAQGPSLIGLVVGHTVLAIPYVVRTVSGVLSQSDRFTEEAARTMGARWWQRYWHVVLPLCRPGILAGAFFAFNVSFDDAVIALFVRTPTLETLPLAIYGRLEFSPDPSVAAVSTLMVLVTVVVIAVIERVLGLGKVFN